MVHLTYGIIGLAVAVFLARRILTIIRYHRRSYSNGCEPPGRRTSVIPIFNVDLTLEFLGWLKNDRRIQEMSRLTYLHNHTVDFFENGSRYLWTTDPRNAKSVLATDFHNWGMGPQREQRMLPLMGRGILTAEGEQWKGYRKLVKPTFDRSHTADRGMIEKHVNRFLDQLPKDRSTVNLSDSFSLLVVDAGTQFVLGESPDTLLPGGSGVGRGFKDAMHHAQRGLIGGSFLGRLGFLIRDRKVQESCNTFHEFIDDCIDRATQDRKTRENGSADGQHVLLYDLLGQTDDRQAWRDQLTHVFFGATETVASTLVAAIFCMARDARVWKKLRDEVRDVDPEKLTFERTKGLTYLQYIVREVLRLHSPGQSTTRMCHAPTTLPFGGGPDGTKPVAVSPGDHCSIIFGGMHRHRDVFGADADEFRPERWESEELRRLQWEYIPFSGGPRVCPAQQLALYWVAYTLARIAMVIEEVENRDDTMEFVAEEGGAMRSRNGAKVALKWA